MTNMNACPPPEIFKMATNTEGGKGFFREP